MCGPVREKRAELDLERLGAHLEGFAQLIVLSGILARDNDVSIRSVRRAGSLDLTNSTFAGLPGLL